MIMMMNCIDCECSIESCFCSCPYCGNIMERCLCNQEYSNDREREISNTHYSKLRLSKQSKKATFVKTKDQDNEWCLEKWQIGRSKFS